MPSNWRWKTITILASVVISLYVLVPTFMGWSASEGDRPAVAQLFPKKGLNLGLDLKGGIYIEFDVVLEDALHTRADILHTELQRVLKSDRIAFESLDRVPDTYSIAAVFSDEAGRNAYLDYMATNYAAVLHERRDERTENTAVFELTDSYRAQTEDMTMRQAVETIRGRIDKYGVAEPSIQRLGANKVSVELPGVRDPDRAIDLIKRGGKLQFKLVDEDIDKAELEQWIAEARGAQGIEGFSEEDVAVLNEVLKDKLPTGTEILFEVHYDPISKQATGGTAYPVKQKAELTGDMLSDAQVQVQGNEPYVSLTFNEQGAEIFGELTGKNIGKRLAIILDDRVSSAPVIQSKIPHGRAQITLGFGNYQSLLREAEDLTLVLREGALPATLVERTKTIVGPSLGRISIEKAVKALLLGGALIVLFMVGYYRLSGLFANIALCINVLLIFAILTLFQATLTLPGLAGIILTTGMAVDANIIVFERIREELRAKKNPRAAVQKGYENAMSSIIDANVTTFLAGIVLYQFGTGPVRGFAVTLMIGIVTTLYTALFITKAFQMWNVFVRRAEKLSI